MRPNLALGVHPSIAYWQANSEILHRGAPGFKFTADNTLTSSPLFNSDNIASGVYAAIRYPKRSDRLIMSVISGKTGMGRPEPVSISVKQDF